MFISKACLVAILENLSVLNHQVDEIKSCMITIRPNKRDEKGEIKNEFKERTERRRYRTNCSDQLGQLEHEALPRTQVAVSLSKWRQQESHGGSQI